jgi:hypothetical protein
LSKRKKPEHVGDAMLLVQTCRPANLSSNSTWLGNSFSRATGNAIHSTLSTSGNA